MTSVVLNQELKGVEIYFDSKPIQSIIDTLKSNGFRYHSIKVCWYAKQNEKTLKTAYSFTEAKEKQEEVKPQAITETKTKATKEKNLILPLWDRIQFTEGNEDTSKYRFKFVGSNYSGLTTKETAAIIRKHLKGRFPEVKFSITSDYNHISIDIKSSPYNNLKLPYDYSRPSREYREYEEENNKEIIAITEYCQKLLDSYNYDDSDSMTDYFHVHFYDSVSVAYDYIQTEQTEEQKLEITEFRNKLEQEKQAEEIRKDKEFQEYLIQQEEQKKGFQNRIEEEKKQIEIINNSVAVKDLEEEKQYYVIGSQFANLNKNNTIEEYKEEIQKGEYSLENVKITKEVHFQTQDALNYFSNLLLTDFSFLEHTGGSFTEDSRINSMIDFDNMEKEERESVIWNLLGVAVYHNNKLQFVIDAQGFSYARYVGLVDNVQIKKSNPIKQLVNPDQLQELKDKAETLEDISASVITNNDLIKTWDNENWNEYKQAMKDQLKKQGFKLNKSIIQQLPEDHNKLKSAMYKLLKEVDGIQEQFRNADIKQGQKVTLFYISDFGSVSHKQITIDSIDYTKYAQYNDNVKITFKPQGKRSLYYNNFHSTLLVYNGWLDLPETVLNDIEAKDNFVITKTKYMSCDKKQLDEVLGYFEGQGITPIVNTYKPIL